MCERGIATGVVFKKNMILSPEMFIDLLDGKITEEEALKACEDVEISLEDEIEISAVRKCC